MKVYVAGASAEIDRARRVIAELHQRGHEVLFDWPAAIDAAGGRANGLSEERVHYAREDYGAALACDVLVLLVPSASTIGAWVELGAALSQNALVLASGLASDFERTIFTALAHRRFVTHELGYESRADAHGRADDCAIAWLDGYSMREAAE